MNRDDKKLVFVSYAHADKEFIDRELMPFLRQLELGEQIELWHDQLIGTGENWYAEIADRLDHAKVAILLITPAFLGSKFCQHEEVPVLLQRARRGELRVLPVWSKNSSSLPVSGKLMIFNALELIDGTGCSRFTTERL